MLHSKLKAMGNELSTIIPLLLESPDRVEKLREWISSQDPAAFNQLVSSELGLQIQPSQQKNSSTTRSPTTSTNAGQVEKPCSDEDLQRPSKDQIERWTLDFASFWESRGSSPREERTREEVFVDLVERSAKSSETVMVHFIQIRHIQVFFYELVLQKFPVTTRNKPRTYVSEDLCRDYLLYFGIKDPSAKFVANFHNAVICGKRYSDFEGTDNGLLVVLPYEVEKHMWVSLRIFRLRC